MEERTTEMAGFKAPDGLTVSDWDMKVELDKRALFALASDTRLEMLKALEPHRRTVSQLAEVLGIDKAAVHRHLKKLEEGGFVVRAEDHGFVYYALTWKSRDILNPSDRTKIIILISSSIVCLLAMAIVVFLASSGPGPSAADEGSIYQNAPDPGADGTSTPDWSGDSWGGLLAPAVLGLAAAAFLASAYMVWRVPRQRGGEENGTLLDAAVPLGED